MANKYELISLSLITRDRTGPIPTKAIPLVLVTDLETGSKSTIREMVVGVSPTVQARLDQIISDAIAYLNAKHPNITITLPQE